MANQIILNNFDTLEGLDKFQAYSQFTENSAEAILLASDPAKALAARDYIFGGNYND